MSLINWQLVDNSVPTYQLAAYQYKILRDGSSYSFSPQSSQISQVYLVGWDCAGPCVDGSNSQGNVINFITDVLGWSYADPGGTVYNGQTLAINTIRRTTPQQHPMFSQMYASSAELLTPEKGGGWDTSNEVETGMPNIKFTIARVKVNFSFLDYRVLNDTDMQSAYLPSTYYLEGAVTPTIWGQPLGLTGPYGAEQYRFTSRVQRPAGEFHSTNGLMQFQTPPVLTLGTQPSKIIHSIQLQYTWHAVPPLQDPHTPQITEPWDPYFTPPNLSAIKNCLGKINSTVFDPCGFAGEPGTVLFTGGEAIFVAHPVPADTFNDHYSGSGTKMPPLPMLWEIKMNFTYRMNGYYAGSIAELNQVPCGWNFTWRSVSLAAGPANGAPFWDLLNSSPVNNAIPPVLPSNLIISYGGAPPGVLNTPPYWYIYYNAQPLYLSYDLNSLWNLAQ